MRLHRTACICASNLGYMIRPTTTTHRVGLGGTDGQTHEASFAFPICCCFIFRLHPLHFFLVLSWIVGYQAVKSAGAHVYGAMGQENPLAFTTDWSRLKSRGWDMFFFAYVVWQKASCCRAVGFCQDGRKVRSRALAAWAVLVCVWDHKGQQVDGGVAVCIEDCGR